MVDGHTFDVPPADDMVMITNDDRPGVIGTVGTLLGNAGINIADMDVGRSETAGLAVMLIAPTSAVAPDDPRRTARRPRHRQRRRAHELSRATLSEGPPASPECRRAIRICGRMKPAPSTTITTRA